MSLGEFALLLVLLVQVVLKGLVVIVHQEVQGVLHHHEVLHHQGVLHLHQGSSSCASSSSRGSSISMGISSSRRSSIRVSSSVRGSSTLVWISPSLQGVSDLYVAFYNHHLCYLLLDIPSLAWKPLAHMCLLGRNLAQLVWGPHSFILHWVPS